MATDTLPESKVVRRKQPSPDQFIDRQLRRTQFQVRVVDIVASLVVWLVAMLGSLLLLALCDHWLVPIGTAGRWLALVALVAGSGYYFAVQLGPLLWRRINSAYAAKVIEDAEPSLKNSLLNFLLLRGNSAGVPDVVVDALRQRAASDLTHAPVDRAVDHAPLIRLGYVLCGVMVVFAAYKLLSPKDPFRTVARVLAPWAEIARPSRVQVVRVEPGDKEVYQGQTIVITADVGGARSKDVVELVYSTADGQTVDAVAAMAHSAGVQYQCEFPPASTESGIQQDVLYRVRAGDAESPQYRLKVLPSPRIEVEQVELHYPAYTRRPPQTLRQGDIRAVEGTQAIVRAKANQEIASAYIEFDPSQDANARTPTLAMQSDGLTATADFRLERLADGSARHTTYQVRLRSQANLMNDRPTLHRIEALADLAPEIEILSPMERRVELPLDRTLKIELRGRDPDFGLRKITLELSQGEADLPPAALHDHGQGQLGPINENYVVDPKKLGLQAGDDLVLVGVAEDNRHNAAGELAANVSRTDRYLIHITAPEERQNNPLDQPMPEDEGKGSDENPSQTSKPEENKRPDPSTKPEKPEKRNGDKTKPEKPEPEKNAGDNEDKSDENPGKSPEDKPENKKPEKTKPGEKSPDNKQPKSPNDKKPQQTGSQGGGEDESGDSQEDSKDNQGGSSGGQPGQKKPGSKQGGNSGGAQGDQATGDQNDGSESSDSSGNNNAGAKSNNKPAKGSKPKPAGNDGGNDAGEASDSANSGEEGSENTGSPAKPGAGKPNQARKPGNAGSSDESGGERPQHPGEVIEKLNQELEKNKNLKDKLEKEQRAEDSESAEKPASENTGTGANEKPAGAGNENASEKRGANSKPGDQTGQPREQGGKPGEKGVKPGEQGGKPGEKSDQSKPGEKLEGADKPMTSGQKPGEKSKPGEKTKPGNEAANGTGNEKSDQGTGAGSEKPSAPMASGDKPTEDASSDKPGQGSQSDAGSGKRPEKPNPSGEPQRKSQDRNKTAKPDGGKDEEDAPSASASSKKESDSTGDTKGDEQGGGGQGAGQEANQAGRDTPGSNTSSDTGAGQSNEPGKGETGDKGGEGPQAERPTGASGTEEGPGSKTKPGEKGTKPDGSQGGAQSGGAGKLPPKAKQDRNQSKGGPNGNVATGGGLASDEEPVAGSPHKVDIADTEAENLEYAKKSTDLALRYLKDQKDNPDPELLKKLGWTKDDLNAFLQRWESLKNSAKEGPEAKDELNDAYKSLGLRPTPDKRKSAGSGDDAVRGNRDAGARSEPPPGYAEQFKAFRKGGSQK